MENICKFVINSITEAIYTGKYHPGEKIPSIREWSHKLGVSVNTVHKAIKYLCDVGIIVRGKRNYQVTNNSLNIENYRKMIRQKEINKLLNKMEEIRISKEEIISLVNMLIK